MKWCCVYIGPTAPSSAASKLMTAANTLKETCSRTVSVSEGSKGKKCKTSSIFFYLDKSTTSRHKTVVFCCVCRLRVPCERQVSTGGPWSRPRGWNRSLCPSWLVRGVWTGAWPPTVTTVGRRRQRERSRPGWANTTNSSLHTIYDLSINHRWGDILLVQN